MTAEGYVILTAKFHKEDDQWMGECVELGTAVQANTRLRAYNILREMVCLHLNALDEVGERTRYFKERGIKFYPRKPRTREFNVSTLCPIDGYVQPLLEKVHCVVGV